MSEMANKADKIEYAFVIDNAGKQLSPTRVEKAWYKIHNSMS